MSAFVARLAHEGTLVCPSCRQADWRLETQAFHCGHCGAQWPVRHQVPDFFNRYQSAAAAVPAAPSAPQAELVAAIVRALDLNAKSERPAQVAEIVARASSWACEDSAYTAEINDLLDRFAPNPAPIEQAPLPAPNLQPRLKLVRHYLPASLRRGSAQSINLRVLNDGDAPWSSRIGQGLQLSARWLAAGGVGAGGAADGDRAEMGPMQVRFPVDISAGRAISLPMRIVAPSSAGRYRLCLQLQRLDTEQLVGDAIELPVEVREVGGAEAIGASAAATAATATVAEATTSEVRIEQRAQIPDYGEDHAAGVELIANSLKQAGVTNARILEVGSGTHPHTAWLTDHEVLALDISSPLLELGALYFADRFTDRLGFVCADAFNAPFAPGRFDLVCMFSALHHFQEPEIILRQLAELLTPQGQLAVMCEPVGDSLEQPETVRDLLKGINEQVFSVDEYRQIFALAGLRPQWIRVDGASLKAILVRC